MRSKISTVLNNEINEMGNENEMGKTKWEKTKWEKTK